MIDLIFVFLLIGTFQIYSAFYNIIFSNAAVLTCFPPEWTRLKRTVSRFRAIFKDEKNLIVHTTQKILGIQKMVLEAINEF